jgi:hypothetical protein
MRRSIAIDSKGDADEDYRMNVVALVFEFRQGKNSICFGTTDLLLDKTLARISRASVGYIQLNILVSILMEIEQRI